MIDPQIFVSEDEGEEEAGRELARTLATLEIESPLVVASVHGHGLAAALDLNHPIVTPESGADQAWASELGSRAHKGGADTIVAIGGGRCLDLGKLAAARAGLTLVAVPTQLSHDGICSPVAVVPAVDGAPESIGAIEPRAVFLSMPTIAGAPAASLTAGLGDLLANPLALRDWALAAEKGLEEIDQSAWEISVEAFQRVEPYLDSAPDGLEGNIEFLRVLADALILSGVAMIASGTSRPASGGEHEISHAIDQLYGGRAHHGAQVAFGCIISVALYGEDTDAFRRRLRTLRLPQHPEDLNLTEEDMIRVLLRAPETRPGRFTIIEEADLDEASAKALIEKIWNE